MSWTGDRHPPQHVIVRADQRITAATARGLYDHLVQLRDSAVLRLVQLDLSTVERLDTASAAAICVAVEQLREAGKEASLKQLRVTWHARCIWCWLARDAALSCRLDRASPYRHCGNSCKAAPAQKEEPCHAPCPRSPPRSPAAQQHTPG